MVATFKVKGYNKSNETIWRCFPLFSNYPKFKGCKDVLVVPDLHCSLELLSYVEFLVNKGAYKKLIWLGDYFNRFNKAGDTKLYRETVNRIIALSNKVESIFLVGNHDLAYILGRGYRNNYHANDVDARHACEAFFRNLLSRRLLYYYYADGGYIFSHAGIKNKTIHPPAMKVDLTDPTHIAYLDDVVLNDPGSLFYGRPSEWNSPYNKVVQVFGHTPLESVTAFPNNRIGVDSWSESVSLDPNRTTDEVVHTTKAVLSGEFELDWKVGKCDLLVLQAGSKPTVITTN